MPVNPDRISQIGRGVRVGIVGLVAITASEIILPKSTEAAVNSNRNPEQGLNINSQNNFGMIGDRLSALSANAWECITRFVSPIHARKERPDQNVEGVTLVLYNTTNPKDKVRLTASKTQPYMAAGGYQNFSRNPQTGEDFVLIYGDRKTDKCDNDRNDCPKTEIGAYEEVDGRPATEVSSLRVDCPPYRVCPWQRDWKVEQLPPAPVSPPVVSVPPPLPPTRPPVPQPVQVPGLPRTGN